MATAERPQSPNQSFHLTEPTKELCQIDHLHFTRVNKEEDREIYQSQMVRKQQNPGQSDFRARALSTV